MMLDGTSYGVACWSQYGLTSVPMPTLPSRPASVSLYRLAASRPQVILATRAAMSPSYDASTHTFAANGPPSSVVIRSTVLPAFVAETTPPTAVTTVTLASASIVSSTRSATWLSNSQPVGCPGG